MIDLVPPAAPPSPDADQRAAFLVAADAFLALAADIVATTDLTAPGLGDWTLRELLGHTARSLVTVAEYARPEPAPIEVEDAAAYYVATSTFDPVEIAARGRAAGEALGDDPLATLQAAAADARRALDALGEDGHVATIVGTMRPGEYLRTRTFELVVHCGDLARATGRPFTAPAAAIRDALGLALDVAVRTGRGEAALARLTGRPGLDGSVLDPPAA